MSKYILVQTTQRELCTGCQRVGPLCKEEWASWVKGALQHTHTHKCIYILSQLQPNLPVAQLS